MVEQDQTSRFVGHRAWAAARLELSPLLVNENRDDDFVPDRITVSVGRLSASGQDKTVSSESVTLDLAEARAFGEALVELAKKYGA